MTQLWTLNHGESLAWLRSLPDGCADGVVTDPPYSSGGATFGDRQSRTATKYVQSGTLAERVDFAGDTRDQRSFVIWCSIWLTECLRLVRPGRPVCLFTDWRQLAATTEALQVAGFVFRGVVPWDKTEATRPCMGGFRAQAEYVVWGTAGPRDPERDERVGCLPGVLRCRTSLDRAHMTEKPVEMLREVVRVVEPGGLVLDPFAGSGSTGVAALAEGRRFMGSEVVEHYAGIARARLAAAGSGTDWKAPPEQADMFAAAGK